MKHIFALHNFYSTFARAGFLLRNKSKKPLTRSSEVTRTETEANNSGHIYCYVVTWTMDLVELLDNIHAHTDIPNHGAGAHSASFCQSI